MKMVRRFYASHTDPDILRCSPDCIFYYQFSTAIAVIDADAKLVEVRKESAYSQVLNSD